MVPDGLRLIEWHLKIHLASWKMAWSAVGF